MKRWLILDLCAPLMAFGGVSIDHVGPTRGFPAISMLTGLFGNALGWHWSDGAAHQALQDRLIIAARIEWEGRLVTDSQNAKLEKNDKGWTTHGIPEGRFGASYDSPHRRRRDYLSDARVLVVGNPCNTNCLIAMNNGSELPRDRWFAMTQLDENRARTQLAVKAGVDVTEVTNLAIWGNHSSSMYPDFYNTKIGGKPAPEVIQDESWFKETFIPTIQQRGAAIIKARGASSAASAASAVG